MKTDSPEYLDALDFSIKEQGRNQFQDEVTTGFKTLTDHVYHTWNSRNSPAGFPDLIVLHKDMELAIELKAGSNTPTSSQIAWLWAFRRTGALTFCLWPRHRPVLNRLYAGDFDHPLVQGRLHKYTKV